jgi:hypothetical protein
MACLAGGFAGGTLIPAVFSAVFFAVSSSSPRDATMLAGVLV